MSKEKPAKIVSDSSGADAEVDLDSLEVENRPRLKPPRTLETTLFDRLERMYGDGIKRVLKVQYRYVKKIKTELMIGCTSRSLHSHPTLYTSLPSSPTPRSLLGLYSNYRASWNPPLKMRLML
jgi:hypothetical protein